MQLTLITLLSTAIGDLATKLIVTIKSKLPWASIKGTVCFKKFQSATKTDQNEKLWYPQTTKMLQLLFSLLNMQLLGGSWFKQCITLLRCIMLSYTMPCTLKPQFLHMLASWLIVEEETSAIFQVMDVVTAFLVQSL